MAHYGMDRTEQDTGPASYSMTATATGGQVSEIFASKRLNMWHCDR